MGQRVATCGLAVMYMLCFWVSLFVRAPDSSRGPDSSLVPKPAVLAEIDIGHHVTSAQAKKWTGGEPVLRMFFGKGRIGEVA